MKIAINVLPTESGHNVRGSGFYVSRLLKAYTDYYPQHEYILFSKNIDLNKIPDLVHYPFFDPFFLTLNMNLKFPVVITIHDLIPFVFPERFPVGLKGRIKWMMQKKNLHKSSAIITDSQSSKDDIIKFTGFSHNSVFVIPLAPGEAFNKLKGLERRVQSDNNSGSNPAQHLRKKYNLPDKYVLYVGDATWNKNLSNIIKAVSLCGVHLVMVGKTLTPNNVQLKNKWNEPLNEALDLINFNSKIIRLGYVSDNDLNGLYNLAGLLLMPSFYEGFGLPILEAMKAGCPVLTARTGSIPEVAGKAAFYVDPNNPENIAQGIKSVLSSKKTQQELSLEGQMQAAKFSWKKTAAMTLKVYDHIINNSKHFV